MNDTTLKISQAELNAMGDPIARIVWNSWIAEGKAVLVGDDEICPLPEGLLKNRAN